MEQFLARKNSRSNSLTLFSPEHEEHQLYKWFNMSDITADMHTDYIEEPQIIQHKYKDDLNLIIIHNIICAKFIHEKRKLPSLYDELKKINHTINNKTTIPVQQQAMITKYHELQEYVNEITTNKKWNLYKKQVIPILQKYIEVMSNNTKGIVVIGNTDNTEIPSIVEERHIYIKKYLNIVQKLNILNIDIVQCSNDIVQCPVCNEDIINDDNNTDIFTCKCGYVLETLHMNSDYNPDNQKKLSSSEILEPFNKWLNNFLGVNSKNIKEEMFHDFDKYCIEKKHPTGEEVRNGTHPKYFVPTLLFLTSMMQKTKYSKFYAQKNLIRHLYWGWPLPVLSSALIEQAKQRYIQVELMYDNEKSRPSNINMEILGFLILTSLDYKCNKDDFKIPVSEETIKYANDMWKIFCEKENISYKRI